LSRRPAGTRLVRQLAPLVSLRAGLRWFSACRSRPFLERACHADRLVLGSSGSSRHWSRSALISAVCACCTTQSSGGSSVGLAPRWSLPPTSSVPLSPPRARIPLEFGCSRQFHTCGHSVLTVPRVRWEEDQSATGLLLRTHSAGPVSQTCLNLIRRELLRAVTLDDSTPQRRISELRVWPYEPFIVFASSSSG
jgi:hypothetical protein